MKKNVLFAVLCVLCMYSCKKHESKDAEIQNLNKETIVLFERASSDSVILSMKSSKSGQKIADGMQLNALPGPIDAKYYLGRAYNINIGEIGTPDGIRFPVVDIERLYAEHPDYYLPLYLGNSIIDSYSFSDFSRYSAKSKSTEKVTQGFSLNVKLFQIGAKSTFTSAFSTQRINDSKSVFGVIDIMVRDNSHELLMSTNVLKKVKEQYLNATFLDELYNTSPSEFVNNYGGFFITNFVSGGRAHAIFTGKNTFTSDSLSRESSMDKSMNVSYKFAETADKSTADLGIGNTYASQVALQNNISEFMASVKTYGGAYGLASLTAPKLIQEVNVDLSSWYSSLNDKSKHVLVAFNKNGLRPITDLILQENMRFNINKAVNENGVFKPLQVPRIEASWQSMASGGPGYITTVLRTRFGDELRISDNAFVLNFPDQTAMLNFAKQEALKKLPFYKVQVTASQVDHTARPNNYITSISAINEASMTKYYDAKYNILYLLSQVNGRKFAYSIHNDFLLDTYGIREWVNTMGTSQITPAELETYTIVAL